MPDRSVSVENVTVPSKAVWFLVVAMVGAAVFLGIMAYHSGEFVAAFRYTAHRLERVEGRVDALEPRVDRLGHVEGRVERLEPRVDRIDGDVTLLKDHDRLRPAGK
jgi:hypothetical protein